MTFLITCTRIVSSARLNQAHEQDALGQIDHEIPVHKRHDIAIGDHV